MENEVKEKELKKTGESGDARMRRILLPVMSSINPDLEFTAEISEDKKGLMINQTFYEQPMRTQLLLPIYLAAIAVL